LHLSNAVLHFNTARLHWQTALFRVLIAKQPGTGMGRLEQGSSGAAEKQREIAGLTIFLFSTIIIN